MNAVLVGSFALAMILVLGRLFQRAWLTAQPDEWLLRVRNGKVKDAGIGISIWRMPGDVIARFSSTIQRVRFTVEARTKEHLPVVVEGFILWAVDSDPERAFRAFRMLGIANLDRRPMAVHNRAHLLTKAQHHAFQALLAAEVRGHVSTFPLAELLTAHRPLVEGLEARLATLSETLGIAIERTEISQVQPADARLLRDLGAREEERVREEAANVRQEASARLRQRQAEESTREAAEEAALALAKADGERQIAARKREAEEEQLAFTLDRARRTAEADRDAAMARHAAEEQRSQAAREHEIARLVVEETSRAMAAWKIRDGRWINVGNDSPATAVTKMVLGVKELVGTMKN